MQVLELYAVAGDGGESVVQPHVGLIPKVQVVRDLPEAGMELLLLLEPVGPVLVCERSLVVAVVVADATRA